MIPNQTLVAYSNAFKKLTFSFFLLVAFNAFAQVGVGTQTPMTTLDVSVGATPAALATGNGVTVPSVTDAATTAVAGTNDGQLVYDTTAKAFYYWNAGTSAWTVVGGGGGADFTVGTGGVLTITLDTTNHDFSADTTHNSFHITPTAGFGNDAITLPTPSTNVGRIIVIKNNGGKGVSISNAFDASTAIIATRSGVYVCDGVHWVGSTN